MTLFSDKFILTEKYLEKIFDACNNMYFENSLTKIPVKIIDSEDANGYFKFDIDPENRILKNPRIEISKTHKLPYEILERTMIHEMVHYKIFLDLTEDEIFMAFNAYKFGNDELFNRLLGLGKYGHSGKWEEYIRNINNKYNLKIK